MFVEVETTSDVRGSLPISGVFEEFEATGEKRSVFRGIWANVAHMSDIGCLGKNYLDLTHQFEGTDS